MRKIISFAHISLDGFVAGPKGEMDWIKINDEIFDHGHERISKGDTALYGRTTFQMMEHYWPTAADKPNATKHDHDHSKWYKGIRKLVLSNTLKESDFTNTRIISSNLADEINKIKKEGDKEILLFGSPGATHSLLELDLIDGFWLNVNPVILGQGIPLFKGVNKLDLDLKNTHRYSCGVVVMDYLVVR